MTEGDKNKENADDNFVQWFSFDMVGDKKEKFVMRPPHQIVRTATKKTSLKNSANSVKYCANSKSTS